MPSPAPTKQHKSSLNFIVARFLTNRTFHSGGRVWEVRYESSMSISLFIINSGKRGLLGAP